MARLPQPGGDDNTWGGILNDFLLQAHKNDGTLKPNAVTSANMAPNSVGNSALTTGAVSTSKLADNSVTSAKLDSPTRDKLDEIDDKADASITISGGTSLVGGGNLSASRTISLVNDSSSPGNNKYYGTDGTGARGYHSVPAGGASEWGDLSGTLSDQTDLQNALDTKAAASTTVNGHALTNNVTVTKADVGLSNVDNTSDTNKPISTATQTALNDKASTSTTITGATSLTGGGSLAANRTISLVNDAATPGNSKYYGTNASGTKGYYDLPEGGGGDPAMGGDLSGTAGNAQIVANAVGTNEIADSAVTNAKVASGIAQSKVTNLTSDLAGKQSTATLTAKGDMYIATGSATVTRLPVGSNGQMLVADSSQSTGMRWTTPPITKLLPYSYLGVLATGPGTFRLYNDSGAAWTVVGVRASVGTAPSGASIIVDINRNGTSIFTTQANRPSIAIGANTSGNVTNMDVTNIAVNDYLTVDIDQIGSGVAGTDLMIQIEVF